MKLYGRICRDLNDITTEKVKYTKPGVSLVQGKYICNQCGNKEQSLFYQYFATIASKLQPIADIVLHLVKFKVVKTFISLRVCMKYQNVVINWILN